MTGCQMSGRGTQAQAKSEEGMEAAMERERCVLQEARKRFFIFSLSSSRALASSPSPSPLCTSTSTHVFFPHPKSTFFSLSFFPVLSLFLFCPQRQTHPATRSSFFLSLSLHHPLPEPAAAASNACFLVRVSNSAVLHAPAVVHYARALRALASCCHGRRRRRCRS